MFAVQNSCCSNTACVLVIIVASLYFRSWMMSTRSVLFVVLLRYCVEVSTSVSIPLDDWDWVDVLVARVAMAVLNCSTAVVIMVLSSVNSCLIDINSVAYSLLNLVSAGCFVVLWLFTLLLLLVVASVTLVDVLES